MAIRLKRRLSEHEEFEIMRLVLDKFLWLGTVAVGFGLYKLISSSSYQESITYLSLGVVLMLLFSWLVIREFEQLR